MIKNRQPCDQPDEFGNYHCVFVDHEDITSGCFCRDMCGLGCDESVVEEDKN